MSQELRLVSQGTSDWNWIVGAFYNRYKGEITSAEHTPGIPDWYGFPPGTPDLEYYSVSNETYEEKALFGEVGYRLTDKWQVTLGGRWFDTDDDMELQTAFPFFGSDPGRRRTVRRSQEDQRQMTSFSSSTARTGSVTT